MTSNTLIGSSLKATCPRKDLFAAVQVVGRAVSGRSTLPILSHILLRTEPESIRLIATDLELGISCRVAAAIKEEGSLTAPARTLGDALGTLPDRSDVDLSADRSFTTHVRCERSTYKILGLPAEDYPQLPEVPETVCFKIPQKRLRDLIRQTQFAVSSDEARATLTGIYMEFDGSCIRFVATDTHRLATRIDAVSEGTGSLNVIVPARAMNELNHLLSDAEGEVKVVLASNQIAFHLPGEDEIQIVSRIIEGHFPNYKRVIPESYTRRITVSTSALLSAVRRAFVVAKDVSSASRVVLRTSDAGSLILTAENQTVGSAYEEVEARCEGETVEVAFNAKYLMDVLVALEEESVYLEITEPLRPAVLRPVPPPPAADQEAPAGTAEQLCVLMPMQVV